MPRVFIPPLLRPLAGGADVVDVPGGTVAEAIDRLDQRCPGLRDRLCEGGSIRPGLAVAVDGDVTPRGLHQKLRPDSEVHFLPALGGG